MIDISKRMEELARNNDKLILVTKKDLHNMQISAIKEFIDGLKYRHDKLVEYELESYIAYLNKLEDI